MDLQTGGEVTKGEVGVGVFVLVGVGPPGVEVGGVKVGLFIHQKLQAGCPGRLHNAPQPEPIGVGVGVFIFVGVGVFDLIGVGVFVLIGVGVVHRGIFFPAQKKG